MQFDLSAGQLEYLTSLLERDHHLLEYEICRTDHREFKQLLRQRLGLCASLLDKIARAAAQSAA